MNDGLEIKTLVNGVEESENDKAGFVKQRQQYEFDITKDPATGKIPSNIRSLELMQVRNFVNNGADNQRVGIQNTYTPVGPNNIGGRTRALALDIRFGTGGNQVIIAGSVSGGIMRSANGGASWTMVSPPDQVFSLSTVAQDTRAGFQQIWYAGGGEPIGNSAAISTAQYLGDGVLKSVDNGLTWQKLTNNYFDQNGTLINTNGGTPFTLEAFDNPFDIVHKIVVNPVNGHVYIAGHRRLLRSTDGGSSFRVVFTGTTASTGDQGQMDLVISNTGRLFLGVNGGIPDKNLRGLWTSASGDLNSWTRIAGGQTLNTDSVSNWRGNSTNADGRRIVLALVPSNQNRLLAMYENGLSQEAASDTKPEVDLFKFDVSNNSVTNLSANMPDLSGQADGVDPLETQGGYNMIVAVKPDNENVVFIGATNLYRSTDGFSSNVNTKCIGGYGPVVSPLRIYTNSHPDFHNLVFDPLNANRLFASNDGGLQVTTDVMANPNNANGETVAWTMVSNYQTLQYYHVGIDPAPGQDNAIGGAQDNGTYFRNSGGTTPDNHIKLLGGDGAAAAIANVSNSSFLFYCTVQSGTLYRDATNTFNIITPNGLTANPSGGFGDFVTYFKMNADNPSQLYYVNFNRIFRTKNAATVSANTWDEMTGVGLVIPATFTLNSASVRNTIRAIELTRGPYNDKHTLYIGTAQGKIYRLDDPANASVTAQPLEMGPSLPAGANIADIAVNPNNDDEVMAVVSNYNTTSIWFTSNARSTSPLWKNAEGNLTLPSVRSCMIVTKKDASNVSVTEYYVGTSVGLFSAENIATALQNNTPVNWSREGSSSLGFAVVVSLDYRPQDNTLLIGTHGNGMFLAKTGTPDFRPGAGSGGGNTGDFFVKIAGSPARNYIDLLKGNVTGVNSMDVQIFNMAGQLTYKKRLPYADSRLDISLLPAGIYIVKVFSDNGAETYSGRFIKQ